MKHAIKFMVLSGLIAVSAQAMADNSSSDTSTNTTAEKTQAMKDCMAKQKATNSGMTHAAMKTTCKNQISGKGKNGNDLASGPQAQGQNQSQPPH
jgi:hypothetical protein